MTNTEDEPTDMSSPQRPASAKRRPFPDEVEDSADNDPAPTEFYADACLPGAVLMVPNRHWGFEVVSATDHPGACARYEPSTTDAILVKGTDAEHVRHPRRFFFADPDDGNGLHKRTAFELLPRLFRVRRLRLLFPERHLGRLAEATLQALRAELARLHPEE